MKDSKLRFPTIAYLSISVALAFVGCTRATNDFSALKITIPNTSSKASSMSAAGDLAHLAINITGSGITSPIVFTWDGHQNGEIVTAPPFFTFTVPKGDSRLVQVLAVYKNMTTGALSFNYGDTIAAFNAADVAVSITVTPVGLANPVEGQISGRYLTSANSGPTGVVDMYYNPGNGKKPLIVDRSFIAKGWFSFFGLSGVPLEYQVGSLKLFGGPIELDSPLFVPTNSSGNLAKVVRAAIPSFVRSEGGGGSKRIEQAQTFVWGFWGDSSFLAGKFACNDLNSGGAFSRIYQYNSNPVSANTLLTLTNAAGAEQTYPTNSMLQDTVSPLLTVTAGGGSFTACSSPVNATYIPVRKNLIDGNGKDNSAGFKNIFLINSNGSTLDILGTGNTASISGVVLPGVSTIYDRIKFYKRIGTAGENFRIDTPACSAVANGASGFSFIGESSPILSSGSFSSSGINLNTTSSEYSSGAISLVACGASGSELAPIGLFQEIYSGGPSGPYLRIELTGAGFIGQNYLATVGNCYPLSLKLYDPSGGGMATPHNVSSPVTVSGLAPGGTWYEIHSVSNCSSQVSSTNFLISTGNAYSTQLWFKPLTAGPNQIFSGVTASGDGISFSPSGNMVNVGNPQLAIKGPSDVITYSASSPMCYAVDFNLLDGAGNELVTASNLSVNYSGSGYTLFDTYADCSSNVSALSSPLTISMGLSKRTVYMQPTSTGSLVMTPAAPAPFSNSSYNFNSVALSPTNSVSSTKFQISAVSQEAGRCNKVEISHVNSAGKLVPILDYIGASLSSSSMNIRFYSDSFCMNILTENYINFVPGDSLKFAYFKTTGAIGETFDISIPAGGVRGVTAAPIVTTTPIDGPYLSFDLPKIKSSVLGSHEFPKTIALNVSPGASLSCIQASSPSFDFSPPISPCAGLSGNTFTWSAADAIAGTGFMFRVSAPNGLTQNYEFVPKRVYQKIGEQFTVLDCAGAPLAANSTTGFSAINTAFGVSSVVCLSAGNFSDSANNITISSTGRGLIGINDSNGNPLSILQARPSNHMINLTASFSGTLANSQLVAAASGTGTNFLVSAGGVVSGNFFKSFNNIYEINQYHQKGIFKNSYMSILSRGDSFNVDGTISAATGISVDCGTTCGTSPELEIKDVKFKLSSPPTDTAVMARGININNSELLTVVVDGAKIDPSFANGNLITIDNSPGTNTATFRLYNSNLDFAGAGFANNSRFPFYLSRHVSFEMNNVLVKNNTGSDIIRSNQTSPSDNLSLILKDSRLVTMQDTRAIFVNTISSTQSIATTRTHFVRTGSNTSNRYAIESTNTYPLSWTLEGPLTAPTTYFCYAGSSNYFGAFFMPTILGGYTSPILKLTNNPADFSCTD